MEGTVFLDTEILHRTKSYNGTPLAFSHSLKTQKHTQSGDFTRSCNTWDYTRSSHQERGRTEQNCEKTSKNTTWHMASTSKRKT